MAADFLVAPDRFIVVRDKHIVAVTDDRKKAEQIVRHFKRLRPNSKVVIQDTATDENKEL